MYASSGTYRITTNHDDGMKIYIDGNLLHNHWIDKSPGVENFNVVLASGTHTIKIEYYEGSGASTAIFSIQKL